MLPQVIVRRLKLLDNAGSAAIVAIAGTVTSIELDLTMCLIHMVDVVLLLEVLPVLLIFEYFRENTLRARWLALVLNTHVVAARVLDAHAATMDSVELILDAAAGAWRSASSGRAGITTLGNGRSRDVEFGSSARDEVLRLITTRLDHEALALLATGCR